MLNRPHKISQKNPQTQELAQSTPSTETQHGTQHDSLCLILDIPAEILTGITSHLDPPSLYNLGLVNKRLFDHIRDDGTWHRAFVQQFLGIDFQSELHDGHKRLLLRREAKTWRQEFIARFNLCKKWAYSRSSTLRHIPVHSVISSMHLMPTQSALLCASRVYGIVSRSLPLTGKILPGYINPTGPRIGIGIGNPNVEFAPNVSTCLLGSDGATAKVLWGIRNGEVTITVAPKAIDPSRRGIGFDLRRCLIDDEHDGPVLDAAWDDQELAVTGGADGRIKLWDTRTMRCLWTSERQHCELVTDPIIKVASAVVTKGIIIGCMRSGNIIVARGFEFSEPDTGVKGAETPIQSFTTPCPVSSSPPAPQTVTSLYIDNHSSRSCPTLLVAYENDAHFYKVSLLLWTASEPQFQVDIFGDKSFGQICCASPFFAAGRDQYSFVLVGDRIGCVSVYDWRVEAVPGITEKGLIRPVRRFEAHDDSSPVTAIHWDGTTLITGSTKGTTHVFDGLTFEKLRSFASPTPKFRGRGHAPPVDPNDDGRVQQILVNPDRDVMVANVGNAVLAWKAGPIGKHVSGGVRGRTPLNSGGPGRKKHHGGKWLQHVELKQNIAESRHLLEQESKRSRKARGRAQEHQATLDQLGLSEQEALEYAMMLSREESSRDLVAGEPSTAPDPRHAQLLTDQELSAALEEGVFGCDTEAFSDYGGSAHSGSGPITLSASSSTSSSYENDQTRSAASSDASPIPSVSSDDVHQFPPISISPTPINTPGLGSHSPPRINTGSSRPSAWNVPLRTPTTSPPGVRSAPSVGSSPLEPRHTASTSSRPAGAGDNFDEELRFALELSLVEARSRGEV